MTQICGIGCRNWLPQGDQRGICRERSQRRDDSKRKGADGRMVMTRIHAGKMYMDPVTESVSAFGPATVANLGPGFDWLGCAIDVRFVLIYGELFNYFITFS